MKLSFIIPAYNEERYLPECLEALTTEIEKNCGVFETEIIVVDNASTDATASVAKMFSGVSVITEPKKGVALARQKGLEAATGDLVAYIDADTKVAENWALVMLSEFAGDPKLTALSGYCALYDLPPFWRMIERPYQAIIGRITDALNSEFVYGGNFVARRESMLAVGGFDTSIRFYGEDQHIVKRLKKIGKYKFSWKLLASTSARRYNAEGVLKTVGTYAINFLSTAVFGYPTNSAYRDIR